VFRLAFPHEQEVKVDVYPGSRHDIDGLYISFEAPHVRASDIVTMAHKHEWVAASYLLGVPWYIDFQGPTPEMLLPLSFENVPTTLKDDFIADLPRFFAEELDTANEVDIIDVWEQKELHKKEGWVFSGHITALVCIQTLPVTLLNFRRIVDRWPGWLHWQYEHLIKLQYPGRFRYCNSCKHTAQDLDEPTAPVQKEHRNA